MGFPTELTRAVRDFHGDEMEFVQTTNLPALHDFKWVKIYKQNTVDWTEQVHKENNYNSFTVKSPQEENVS